MESVVERDARRVSSSRSSDESGWTRSEEGFAKESFLRDMVEEGCKEEEWRLREMVEELIEVEGVVWEETGKSSSWPALVSEFELVVDLERDPEFSVDT